ncbi:hypothetical protein ACVSTP_21300, partial [Yersinia enterocolitica]
MFRLIYLQIFVHILHKQERFVAGLYSGHLLIPLHSQSALWISRLKAQIMPCRPETTIIQNLGLQETVNLASGALQKNQNGADIPNKDKFVQTTGACRAFGGSVSTGAGNWTTAQFIEWLNSQWAFNHPYWMCKCSWSYGNNKIITDTGCGLIHLAGCVIEVMGTKGAMTIRVTTPSTSNGGGTTNAQFTYINHGADYAPGWRRDWNRAGDTMTGGLTFENDSVLAWFRNTDWAKIGFKNDGDSDTDSFMWFETGDNGNEYFKWSHKISGGS